MSLSDQFGEYVAACFTGIYINSHEQGEAIREISQLAHERGWSLATWNIASGLQVGGQAVEEPVNDPLAVINAAGAMADGESTSILVLENFHRFLQSAEVIQAVARQVIGGKATRTILVVLAPVVQLPVELEKLFVVLDHELPSREQLQQIAAEVATEAGELPEGDELDRVLDAASGLTRYEAENAFALCLVRGDRLAPVTLWEQKSQMLTKTGTLNLYDGNACFDALGGLGSLKAFTRRALARSNRGGGDVRARGVMLLSPPGCGKSEFCKALGREVGRPVLQLDVGALMGSLVGESEQRTRQALAIVDAMAPCVLMIDEVEKAFAGAGGSGANDSGVSSRMFGTVLSWLNDHTSDVFVVCTANDVSKLPSEFTRAGRFDGVFFVDLPAREQKDSIWSFYMERFGLDANQIRLEDLDSDYSGAEIESCCRISALLDVPIVQAAQNVVPVARTSAESIASLRQWASGRCLDAELGGIYQHNATKGTNRRRVARTNPSTN